MLSKPKVPPLVVNLVDDNEEEEGVGVEDKKKPWVPDDMDPVLEELPKWSLLADVSKEIEEEMMRQESLGTFRSGCKSQISLGMLV